VPRRTAVHRAAVVVAILPALTLGARAVPTPELPDSESEIAARFEAAVTASREQGLPAARAILEPLTEARDARVADRARTVLGLLAHRHDDPALASRLLSSGDGGELDDWRLYVLADSRAALHQNAGARQALGQLLTTHPDSPLRPRVIVRLLDLAGDAGDLAAARLWLAQGRAERLPKAQTVELERTAWRIGLERGVDDLLVEAGRRLLVVAPTEASKLRVVDLLAMRLGSGDWRLWLTPEQLLARARALIDEEIPAGALTTLAAIPSERHGVDWRLLEAEALTASARGAEAITTLASVTSADPAELARAAWQRAEAAREALRTRRGRQLSSEERLRFRRLAREQWLAVVRHGAVPALTRSALRALFADYLAEHQVDEAITTLRQLQALDPTDRTGSRPLWERGWQAYEDHDLAGAEALWRDLIDLYPTTNSARSARYWSARALERLGRDEAARRRYLEVLAADTTDFYARQAGLRLAGSDSVAAPSVEREPWPTDPRLDRAAELSALGLDELARSELALVGNHVDPRAAHALSAIVLSNSGDRRASLGDLLRAFPALATAHQARVPERALRMFYPTDYQETIRAAARAEGLPVALVFGIVHQESAFDARATSYVGARGLMQLMPATGRELARNLRLPYSTSRLLDPGYSVRLGTHYFSRLMTMFDGRVELALASYNGGPGRISRLWRAAGPHVELDRFLEGLSVDESREFVKRILILTESYRSLYPDLG